MEVKIKKVETKQDFLQFVKSQWLFYKNDKNFVPPILVDRMKLLNKQKNPFFLHSNSQEYLAWSNGQIVGRISAIKNDNHNLTHNDKVGFFGFFECVNNQEVANALFDVAKEWLKDQGCDTMRGPVDPSQNDEAGLLIDGFDSPPVVLMKYNPPYYVELIKKYGFEEAMQLNAYDLQMENYASEKMIRMQSIIRERYKITITNLDFKDKKKLREDIQVIKDIYNSAWEKNWGFVKATEEEFDFLVEDLVQIADPNLVIMAWVDGKIAGFALGLPDINEVLINNKNGSLLGAAWHLFTKSKKIKRLRILVLGVLEEYRKTGVDAVLYYEIGARGKKRGITCGEASWILANNEMMNNALQNAMKGNLYKKYMLYQIKL
jgi:GNAT superfamily N-acetyltransferase